MAIVFALLNGVSPRWSWLELIPIAFGFIVLASGLGMLLSALYVRYRDVQPIWDVTLQAWFYARRSCTRLPAMTTSPPDSSDSPCSIPQRTLLTQMGHAMIGGPELPSAVAGAGLPTVLASIALIFVIFGLGAWVFTREAPRVAENL